MYVILGLFSSKRPLINFLSVVFNFVVVTSLRIWYYLPKRKRDGGVLIIYKREKKNMDKKQIVIKFWEDVAAQNAQKLESYFLSNAIINWHNTNECFSVEEYIRANCEYPGKWCGNVERVEMIDDLVISIARVWLEDNSCSFHAVSFFKFKDDKILHLDEYWGDDGIAPQWRLDKKIGKSLK